MMIVFLRISLDMLIVRLIRLEECVAVFLFLLEKKIHIFLLTRVWLKNAQKNILSKSSGWLSIPCLACFFFLNSNEMRLLHPITYVYNSLNSSVCCCLS